MPVKKNRIDKLLESKVKIGFVLIAMSVVIGTVLAVLKIALSIKIGPYEFTFTAILFVAGVLGVTYDIIVGILKAWKK